MVQVLYKFGVPDDELAYPAHHVVLKTTPPELSSATMIPLMTVVADLTGGEDWLSPKPGHAVGDCMYIALRTLLSQPLQSDSTPTVPARGVAVVKRVLHNAAMHADV